MRKHWFRAPTLGLISTITASSFSAAAVMRRRAQMEPGMFFSAGIAALVERATEICVSLSARSILPASKKRFLCGVLVIVAGFNLVPEPLKIGSRQSLMFASGAAL